VVTQGESRDAAVNFDTLSNFIPETRIIILLFAADSFGLPSFNFFWCAT